MGKKISKGYGEEWKELENEWELSIKQGEFVNEWMAEWYS